MKPIIRVENLGKQYRIGQRTAPYATVRESLVGAARAPFDRLRRGFRREVNGDAASGRFWALKDVSFDVKPGEVVGIIGRNGAGKSTLLKILSRVIEPTEGRADLYGRVGSLLEVGTGFHHELTGRENVYLNGVILGMGRRELDRKFDEIVDFAEVEKFLDTPVKRYSSGMQVRLAFAVAAHLDPEILIVDEVLAVGDAAFQKKCLNRLGEVGRNGRTVLYVSHQMSSVRALCTRAIEFERGRIMRDGNPSAVVDHYLALGCSDMAPARFWEEPEDRPGNSRFRLVGMRILDSNGNVSRVYSSAEPLRVEMEFDLSSYHTALCIGFDMYNSEGIHIFRTYHNDRHEREWPPLRVGRNVLRCTVPPGWLKYGTYTIYPKVELYWIEYILHGPPGVTFEVDLQHGESPFWGIKHPDKFPGVIAPCLEWVTN